MSENVREIRSGIRGMHGWRLRAVAAGCAEHVAPVFELLAPPASVPVFEGALDSAWAAAINEGANVAASLESISGLPEAMIDDSNRREYYATLALEVLEHALHVSSDQDVHDAAELACCLALDVYASFDGIALGSPRMVIGPNDPPPKGAMESAEIESLGNIVAILTAASGRRDDVCRQVSAGARAGDTCVDSAAIWRITAQLVRRRGAGVKIVTPGRNEIIDVTESQVSQYLADRGLTAVRSGVRDTLVAFPQSAKDLVEMALNGKLPRVKYRGLNQLSFDVTESLNTTPAVALVTGKHLMREFFSTEGFCKVVRAVTSEMIGAELAVPPGDYQDHKHLAVWRRTDKPRVAER